MKYILIILTAVIMSSCIDQIDKRLDSEEMTFKKISIFPADGMVKTSCSVFDNLCELNIRFDAGRFAGIEKDSSFSGLIRVRVTFLDDHGVLQFKPGWTKYFTGEMFEKHNYFILTQDMHFSLTRNTSGFVFPMYCFHHLPAGKNDIYAAIVISQINGEVCHELFKGFYQVNVRVPEVYSSEFICKGFELQNDSIWSPLHSDFSFGRGLPDLYWAIHLPAADINDYSGYSSSTSVLWNAYDYIKTDTVPLLTYRRDESVLISVYDYDRVGSDEFISSWHGTFKELASKKSGFLEFLPVTRFYYEFSEPECFNCE